MQPDFSAPPSLPLRRPSRAPWVVTILVVLAAGAGVYWGWEERNRLLGELQKAADTAQAAEKTAAARIAKLEMENATLDGERTALRAERDNLTKSVQEKSSALEAVKASDDKAEPEAKADKAGQEKADKRDKNDKSKKSGKASKSDKKKKKPHKKHT